MTEIKIMRLCLENFKCHKNLTLDFTGRNTVIFGDNATGKTSIYDSLTWLLFGKDSQGNGEKNIEIKPLDKQGEVKDHDALTSVEAVLLVNGEEVTLRRTYREVWSTKRGSSQATYDGNTSEYYVNGVPCKKNAFAEKVNELVSEDTFRMLTSVSHFASQISWQDRRAVLFRVAGVMDDTAILATDDRFAPLVESMGRLSLEDYKKKLLAEKKQHVGAKTELPARISECEKTIADIQGLDFAKAKADAAGLQGQVMALVGQIAAAENNDAIRQKDLEIREARLEGSNLESQNNSHRAAQMANRPDLNQLRRGLAVLETQKTAKCGAIQRERSYIQQVDKQIGKAREDWISKNNEVFKAESCPTCGQILPAQKLDQAKSLFEKDKQRRLQELVDIASQHKTAKAAAEERITAMEQEVLDLDQQINSKKDEISQAEQNIIPVTDMPDYQTSRAAIDEKIRKLNGEMMDLRTSAAAVVSDLRAQKGKIEADISALQTIIGKESLLEYSKNRIDILRQDAKNAADCLEAIEGMLFLIDEYSRYKTQFVEDSINGMFRIARFRLFREQANGGIEDRCDVVHDGVPYISVNNGMKINLGIDIINTLSTAYGVKVPLFVDNAESVTKLEQCGSQIIRLVVSENDKELRVNYEN